MPTITLPPDPAANSFTSEAAADAVFDERLTSTVWGGATADEKQRALITATGILDQETWSGTKADSLADNSLGWPRTGVYNKDGQNVANDTVPAGIAKATALLAEELLTAAQPDAAASAFPLEGIKVSTIELKYDTSGEVSTAAVEDGFSSRYSSEVLGLISPYLSTGSRGISIPLARA